MPGSGSIFPCAYLCLTAFEKAWHLEVCANCPGIWVMCPSLLEWWRLKQCLNRTHIYFFTPPNNFNKVCARLCILYALWTKPLPQSRPEMLPMTGKNAPHHAEASCVRILFKFAFWLTVSEEGCPAIRRLLLPWVNCRRRLASWQSVKRRYRKTPPWYFKLVSSVCEPQFSNSPLSSNVPGYSMRGWRRSPRGSDSLACCQSIPKSWTHFVSPLLLLKRWIKLCRLY